MYIQYLSIVQGGNWTTTTDLNVTELSVHPCVIRGQSANPDLPSSQCPEFISVIGDPACQNKEKQPLGEALPWRLNAHHEDDEQADCENSDAKRNESIWIAGPPLIVIDSP